MQWLLGLVLLVLVIVLAACGTDDPSEAPDADTTEVVSDLGADATEVVSDLGGADVPSEVGDVPPGDAPVSETPVGDTGPVDVAPEGAPVDSGDGD